LTVATIAFAPAKLLGPIGKLFGGIISKIPFGDFFLAGLSKVIGVIRGLFAPVRDAFSASITAPIKDLVETLIIRLMLIMDSVKAIMIAPFKFAVDVINGVLTGLINFIKLAVINIKNIFAPIAEWLGSLFRTALSRIQSALSPITDFVGNIVNGIKGQVSPLTNWFSTTFNDIKSRILSINWESIGIDIIKGIGNGIAKMAGWLADQAKAAVGGAKDKLKSFLGIHSPSRVMRDEVGKMLGLGLAEGIEASSKNVFAAMNGLADMSLGTFDIGTSIDTSVADSVASRPSAQPITIINQLDGKEISRTVIKDINQFTFLNGTSPLNI
jgi:phage-related protein